MWVMNNKKINIDATLAIIVIGLIVVYLYNGDMIGYICTHNILKGQW
jgi:uncharacterized membrane protein SpoIIM required for sporulation